MFDLQPEMLLAEAVYSDDEDICAEAMAVLSTTQKKAGIFHASYTWHPHVSGLVSCILLSCQNLKL